MCDPVTIGSLALSAASIGANAIGNSQREAERSRVIQAEDERQQGWQDKSQNLFDTTVQKIEKPKFDADVKAEAAARADSDSKLIDQGGNYVPVTGSAPTEVGQSIARATRRALERNKQQAKLNANVSAYGGVNQKNAIDTGRDAQWQSIFGGNMQRSAAILPAELEDANRAGAGMRGVGQVLGMASTATGMAGMSNPTSWADIFGNGGATSNLSGFAAGAGPKGPTGGAVVPNNGWFGGWF